ncbi:MAG: hypothetical protein AUJ97_07235 [Bacteroidetes bacterium CG2_30_32_10]|nr:MAG: hypothetical protein AUJ97_07235 [Bacteroidetes bacterium CG2_30_32_10]
MTKTRVIVSGFGVVTPYGIGINKFKKGLFNNSPTFSKFKHKYVESCEVQEAALVNEIETDTTESLAIKMALIAVKEAVDNAKKPLLSDSAGVFVGTGVGCIDAIEELFFNNNSLSDFDYRFGVVGNIANAIAQEYGISGQVSTFSTGCSSGNYAIASAMSSIQLGKIDVAICGGVDPRSVIAINCFNRLGGLDKNGIKPFDKNRNGTTIAEGSAFLVLENLENALARNINPIVELINYGFSCDAYNPTVPEPTGEQASLSIKKALEGIDLSQISSIFAHGTGTKLNDAFEAKCLKDVLGKYSSNVPVTALKSLIGHSGGASSAMTVCSAIVCLTENIIYATISTKDIDDNIDLKVVFKNENLNSGYSLINAFAFGGNNAVLLLKKY